MAKHCTITQAELWAVFKALQHVDNKLQSFKGRIKVYTDSRVVIHTLRNQNGRTQLANELIELAQKLGKIKIIKFQWIPGHKGNEGNEMADKLAKRAALKNLPTTYKRIPLNIIKNKIKEIFEQQWQEE
ncbi:ribonuclease H-like [Centruroides vittatus]|uniref:ribonuclease H-like n=1 Tax=Centruroides vittatus TaxID=120091 RepID=UPI00350EB89C